MRRTIIISSNCTLKRVEATQSIKCLLLSVQEPTQYIHALLTTTRPMTLNAYKHETDFEERRKRTEGALNSGRAKVREEIADFRQKLMLANVTIDRFRLELARAKEARAFE